MIKFKNTIRTALRGIGANKSRSGLTILGIVIGITSIMVIASVGQSSERLILSQLSGTGAELVVVRPGREPTGPSDITETLFADSLKQRDVDALSKKSNVPYLVDIAPAVIVPGSIAYQGETYRGAQVIGWSAAFLSKMFDVYPSEGAIFDDADIRGKASVVVIGDKVKRELFGPGDAVGKNVVIKGKTFRIVGVYPPRGQVSFFNIDDLAIIPYTTARSYLLGIDYYNEILVRVDEASNVQRTVRDVEATLRETHNITDQTKDDFFVVTPEGLISQVGNIISILTIFLSAVVAISLVVAGIGVMNIMLVSVTERTREIGLRKAVGATERDILTQFILEAMILTGTGGVIGISLGLSISLLASVVITRVAGLNWPFSIPIMATALGLLVSGLVGLVFGLYPARQAARKNPIEALRYE
ncbi:MAG: ABC transporter permease [Patescibacteria group bacterium]|jgi:putative ABC transport system permease protein